MTTQPTPIILGHRLGSDRDESAVSDLQHTVAKVLAVLGYRRWLLIIALLGGLLFSLAVGLMLPRRYYATALFERRDDVVITKLVTGKSPYSFETLRQSLSVDLKGYNAVAAAVEQLGMTRDYPRDANGRPTPEARAAKQALISRLVGDIGVSVKQKGEFLDLIEVTYLGEQPEIGVKMINRLKDNYMVATRARVAEILHSAHDFFGTEADKYKNEVVAMEADLIRTAVEHPGVSPTDPDLIDQRLMGQNLALQALERDRAGVQSNIKAREEYLRELKDQPDGTLPPAGRSEPFLPNSTANPKRASLIQEMEKARGAIADAKAIRQMTDYHPEVVSLHRKLERLQAEFDNQPERIPSAIPVVPNAGNRIEVNPWETERKRVEMELKSLRDNLAENNRRTRQHQSERGHLEKEKELLFERRQDYLIRQQDLQAAKGDLTAWKMHVDTIGRILTAEAQDRGIQFSSVEEARHPGKPCSPTLRGIFLLSSGIAIALGALVVFLREVLDRSFRDPARVKQVLGIPVLETIGEIHAGAPSRWFNGARLLQAIASVEVMLVLGMGLLIYLSLEKPALYEAIGARSAALWPG